MPAVFISCSARNRACQQEPGLISSFFELWFSSSCCRASKRRYGLEDAPCWPGGVFMATSQDRSTPRRSGCQLQRLARGRGIHLSFGCSCPDAPLHHEESQREV